MAPAEKRPESFGTRLEKSPTGIKGLDEITNGGLPKGRPTLVCGGAGSGKTLLGMEFLVRGATEFNEPGVFMSFEETAEELTKNVVSLGFDLNRLSASRKILLDHVHIERSEIEETGEYDLEGLFIRLEHAIDSIRAKRVVLDTIESLFSGLPSPAILRAELRRLFRWLKNKGMTTVITGERGENTLTRHGLEEYVSDCVIVLDHRVTSQISTRRLRVMKYRGSTHGTNEYPFLMEEGGITVMPITSVGLDYTVKNERISTGIARLDAMMGGKGFMRGSTVLVSGTAGTGKTSIAGHFVEAACRRGERSLYLAFEESPSQIMRNLRSIGIDLQTWEKKGLLQFSAGRATGTGLEGHLVNVLKVIDDVKPRVVVMDPITTLITVGTQQDVKTTLTRLIDHLKSAHITSLMTSLTSGGNSSLEETEVGISSLADTWLLLRDIELGGERNRGLYILKSRGMAHSNQVREFLITDKGVDLLDVYVGPGGVLTGSARVAQEAREKESDVTHHQEMQRQKRQVEAKRKAIEAQIASLQAELQAEQQDFEKAKHDESVRQGEVAQFRKKMGRMRKADKENGKERSHI